MRQVGHDFLDCAMSQLVYQSLSVIAARRSRGVREERMTYRVVLQRDKGLAGGAHRATILFCRHAEVHV